MFEILGSGPWSRRALLISVVTCAAAMGSGLSQVGAVSGAQTQRVSVSSTGTQANGQNLDASISADGRLVAFESYASNLVRKDTNSVGDVFVYNRATGKTQRVSVSSSGAQANRSSIHSSISANGRFVAFQTKARLIRADTNSWLDVFVYDRATGRTQRVSVSSTGAQANEGSYDPSISARGRYVAFTSAASNLIRSDTNEHADAFVFDRTTRQTTRVNVSSTGVQSDGGGYNASISPNGRFVTYESAARDLVDGDTNGQRDVFVYDRTTHQTERVSVSSTGAQANGGSSRPSISTDGRFVTFTSIASNLVRADTDTWLDVFVYDRTTHQTQQVSVSSTGTQANNDSYADSISTDGRYVTFGSYASNLIRSDTNRRLDVFVYDRVAGETRRVSVSSTGTQANSINEQSSISADGRFVAFASYASNLVASDTNSTSDVFVRGPLH